MDEVTNKVGIPIELENRIKEGWVDGRLLHQELKVGRWFRSWVIERIKRCGFVLGVDYQTIYKKPVNRKGRAFIEYYFSTSMAEKLIAIEQSHRSITVTNLQTFTFGRRKLRAMLHKEKPYFFATDICNILGINQRHQVIDDIERESSDMITANIGSSRHPINYRIVDELGLYLMFFRSKKSGSTEACKWLINEAMPQIRKAFGTVEKPTSVFDKVFHFFKSFTGGAK